MPVAIFADDWEGNKWTKYNTSLAALQRLLCADADASVEIVLNNALQELQSLVTLRNDLPDHNECVQHEAQDSEFENLELLALCAEGHLPLDDVKKCAECGASKSPAWRVTGTLCNSCGLKTPHSRELKKLHNTTEYKKKMTKAKQSREHRFAMAADLMTKVAAESKPQRTNSRKWRKCKACGKVGGVQEHWRCGGKLCNSCGLGANRVLCKSSQT
jgi:hypothetical protein